MKGTVPVDAKDATTDQATGATLADSEAKGATPDKATGATLAEAKDATAEAIHAR